MSFGCVTTVSALVGSPYRKSYIPNILASLANVEEAEPLLLLTTLIRQKPTLNL